MNITNFISCDKMNAITESILQKAGISTDWQGSVVKINIDVLIEFEYELEIEWKNIDHYSPGDTVLAAIIPKRKLIYLNDAKRDFFMEKMGTMNFSKAHELGHWVLHVTYQQDYEQLTFSDSETFFCRNQAKKPPQETQADMFAAYILMPKDIITGAVNLLKKRGCVNFGNLYKLKDEFEVSISALKNRIQDLGLLYFNDNIIYLNEAEAIGQMTLF